MGDRLDEVRHIFFDLDGTLIGSAGTVDDDLWEATAELRRHDSSIGFSVCTGRTCAGIAQRVSERLEPDGLHIFESGGLIVGSHDRTAVSVLDRDDLKCLVEATQRIDATVEFYTTDGAVASRLDDDCLRHAEALEMAIGQADLDEIAHSDSVIRAHWIMREDKSPNPVDQVRALALQNAEIGVACSPVLPGLTFASITRAGTSKGEAARIVADRLNFDLRDAIGLGDAEGDIPLLEAVGHPFVMENAPAMLRDRYPSIGHVDRGGVAALLRELVVVTA